MEDLQDLELLSDQQILSLLQYRKEQGAFISKYELQAVPLLNINSIKLIFPLVSVGNISQDYHVPLWTMIQNSKKNIYLKTKYTVETKKAFRKPAKYAGNKYTYFSRFKAVYENRLKIGFTGEKDAGENFFKGNNKYGFDYNSFHIFLYKYKKWLKEINIGDYTVSLGQGLIAHNDFARGKSSLVTNIKKNTSRIIRPYNSVNENSFFRGIGATINLNNKIETSIFVSYRFIDGNILNIQEDTIHSFTSSLLLSGFHRTQSEIENKNSISQFATGSRVNMKIKNGHLAINSLYIRHNKELVLKDKPYYKYRFSGKTLANISFDYSYIYKNILFFGEMARSKNNAYALLQGMQFVPSSKLDIALLYRNYSKSYQSLNSNSFGESIGTSNEKGLYLGINLYPGRHWQLGFYHDIWRFPWLRYKISNPSDGSEFFIIARYTKRHKYEFYIQYKHENKDKNYILEVANIDKSYKYLKKRLRFHFDYKINKYISLRNRLELSQYDIQETHKNGILIYQDIIFKNPTFPLSFTFRYALFQTSDFETAIYAYENDILGESFIPAYYGKGYRTYINLRYRINKHFTLESRWARWYLPEATHIGSGNEEIDTNHKTGVKFQLKYNI